MVIGIIKVDNVEVNNVQFYASHVGMLGDTGSQGNMLPLSECHACKNGYGIFNMAN